MSPIRSAAAVFRQSSKRRLLSPFYSPAARRRPWTRARLPAPSASLRTQEHPPPPPFSMRSTHPRFGCFLSLSCSPFLSSTPPPPPVAGPRPSGSRPSAGAVDWDAGSLPSTLTAGCSGSQAPGTPQTNFWCVSLSPKRLSARSLISELSRRKGAGAGSQAGRQRLLAI